MTDITNKLTLWIRGRGHQASIQPQALNPQAVLKPDQLLVIPHAAPNWETLNALYPQDYVTNVTDILKTKGISFSRIEASGLHGANSNKENACRRGTKNRWNN